MKGNVSPAGTKLGISLIMTLVYALGAAWFYYLPARGEPNLDVEFSSSSLRGELEFTKPTAWSTS